MRLLLYRANFDSAFGQDLLLKADIASSTFNLFVLISYYILDLIELFGI